jgi:hypothetical protein
VIVAQCEALLEEQIVKQRAEEHRGLMLCLDYILALADALHLIDFDDFLSRVRTYL